MIGLLFKALRQVDRDKNEAQNSRAERPADLFLELPDLLDVPQGTDDSLRLRDP
jgi:hypothetical protein